MDELISKRAVIEAIENNDNFVGGSYDIIKVVKNIPPAEPDIIRCKDCKWWDRYNDYNGYCMAAKSCTYTTHWDIQIRRKYDGDFYCAHAELKEEYEGGGEDE